MNEGVLEILEVKRLTTRANIAISIPVGFQQSIDTCQQKVMADVELPPAIQKGLIDVALYYVCHCFSALVFSSS